MKFLRPILESLIMRCKIDNCERNAIARGWCHTHYKRWQVHGDPLVNHKPRDRKCSIEGCENKHASIGYCAKHERHYRRYGRVTTYLRRYESFIAAYEDQVIRNKDGCWGWSGSISSAGYSLIFCNHEIKWGHRFSFEYHREEIRQGYVICHHCDNPVCTRPDHLFQGTMKDNIQDCIRKGRFKLAPDESKAQGERVSGAKLKESQVIEIKKMIKEGMKNPEIARLYEVTHGNISCIRLGQTWKHVEIKNDNAEI